MNKLLSAEFVRLFKSSTFRLCLMFSAFIGILNVWARYVEHRHAEGLIFYGGFYLIFAISVFISIFWGTEYSDGTIRNKLTVGHTRGNIYLSKFIVCATADIMMHLLYILVVLVSGNLLMDGTTMANDGTTMTMTEILSFTMASITAMLALTALLVLLSMSIQSKAIGAIVLLLTTFILFLAAFIINSRLGEPEYYDGYTVLNRETGEAITMEKEKNPNYLTGTKREIYEFLNNFLPVPQLYQVAMNISDNLHLIVLYDCLIIIVTTGAGVIIFKRKNLK